MDDFVVRIFMTNLLAVFLSNQINCFDVQKNPDYTVIKIELSQKTKLYSHVEDIENLWS